MAKKRDLLSALTREHLIELADAYEVGIDRSRPKQDLIESLASSHRIKTEGLLELSAKIASLGNVPAAVFESKQGFFEETAIAAFDQVDTVGDTLSVAVAAYEVIEPGYCKKLTTQIEELRGAKIARMESAPDHIWPQLSPKQRTAFKIAKRLTYQIPNFVETAVNSSRDTDLVKRFVELESRALPARVAYYVGQSYRTYIAGCYDASIVMLARALENLVRHRLERIPSKVDQRATLGQLIEQYRQRVGNDRCLEKVLEVANMDRIVSAHDVPPYYREMDRRDADHAWTAFDIVIRELRV